MPNTPESTLPVAAPAADTAPTTTAPPAAAASPPAAPVRQKHNPLHGVTLEAMVSALHEHYGWDELAHLIPIRCFALDPSVASSLKFLRKTPWARDKVESLYLFMGREQRRGGQR